MKRKLIVVDTETAGLDPHTDALLTFGAVIYENGWITGKFKVGVRSSLLRMDHPLDYQFPVNGIKYAEALTWDCPLTAVNKFKHWLNENGLYGKQTLAAHNATFDSGFLRALWKEAGENFEEQFDYRMLCTQTAALLLEQAGRITLAGGSASLKNVAAGFGLPPEPEPHDALEGAILAAKVLGKMVERLK